MSDIQIIIERNPYPLKRHRKAKVGHMYDPNKAEKQIVKRIIASQLPKGWVKPEGAISIDYYFYMPIPKSYKNIKPHYPHIKKPDLDNMEKMYSDCMNDLVFKDDSQIYSSHSVKIYSDKPGIGISLYY